MRETTAAYHELVVDLDQLSTNVDILKAAMRPARLCAVLKNDAYGHGLLACARIIARRGVEDFAVVNNHEISLLRQSGDPLLEQARLWRIRPPLPWEIEEARECGWRVIEPVGSLEEAQLAGQEKAKEAFSITLDCSMGREGFGVPSHIKDLIHAVQILGGDRVEGLMSHLANADGDEGALGTTHRELDDFDRAVGAIHEMLKPTCIRHVGNSAASLRLARVRENYEMVRCGAILFGETTSALVNKPAGVLPCLSWRTWVAQVREIPAGARVGYGSSYIASSNEHIATLPLGYADGLKRTLANGRGELILRGVRCPVRGGISSASTVIGIDRVPGDPVKPGEEVTIIGSQGDCLQTPDDLARSAGTGHLDLQAGIRAPIRYVGQQA